MYSLCELLGKTGKDNSSAKVSRRLTNFKISIKLLAVSERKEMVSLGERKSITFNWRVTLNLAIDIVSPLFGRISLIQIINMKFRRGLLYRWLLNLRVVYPC